MKGGRIMEIKQNDVSVNMPAVTERIGEMTQIDYEGDGIVSAIGADFDIASDGLSWKGHARQDLANMESVDVEWDGAGPPEHANGWSGKHEHTRRKR